MRPGWRGCPAGGWRPWRNRSKGSTCTAWTADWQAPEAAGPLKTDQPIIPVQPTCSTASLLSSLAWLPPWPPSCGVPSSCEPPTDVASSEAPPSCEVTPSCDPGTPSEPRVAVGPSAASRSPRHGSVPASGEGEGEGEGAG